MYKFNYSQRLKNKLIPTRSCEWRKGGAHRVKPTPNPKACNHASGVKKTKCVQPLFPTKPQGYSEEKREVFACKILRVLQPIHDPFSSSNISLSLVSKCSRKHNQIQLKLKQKSVSIHPIPGAKTAVQKALVVSPIFSSNSHLLTSKLLHNLPLDVS